MSSRNTVHAPVAQIFLILHCIDTERKSQLSKDQFRTKLNRIEISVRLKLVK